MRKPESGRWCDLDRCNKVIKENLGLVPQGFALTGTSWSSLAEQGVQRRYRFGWLWLVDAHHEADGKKIRVADLLGIKVPDENDCGPPQAAR